MIRPIAIEAVSNGWIATVGCQRIVFTSIGELTALLGDYLRHPEQTEQLFTKTAVNIKHTLLGIPTAPYAQAVPMEGGSLTTTNYYPPAQNATQGGQAPCYQQGQNIG